MLVAARAAPRRVWGRKTCQPQKHTTATTVCQEVVSTGFLLFFPPSPSGGGTLSDNRDAVCHGAPRARVTSHSDMITDKGFCHGGWGSLFDKIC